MRSRNRQTGFTLIELLLSLSILSIVIVVVLSALRIGVRAWEKGENMLSVQQRSRTLLDQISRQLTSAALLMTAQSEQPLVTFAGDSDTIEFTSNLPLVAKVQFRPVHAKYVVETEPDGKKRLLLYEKNITIEDYLLERSLWRNLDGVVLIGALEDLRFEYLTDVSDGLDLTWASSWQSQNLTEMPRAVRIIYKEAKNSQPVQVIARIHLWDLFREET